MGETFFSSSSSSDQTNAAFDGINMNGFTDTSKNPCWIGTAFAEYHIGYLSEVKFFMKAFTMS